MGEKTAAWPPSAAAGNWDAHTLQPEMKMSEAVTPHIRTDSNQEGRKAEREHPAQPTGRRESQRMQLGPDTGCRIPDTIVNPEILN